MLGPSPLTGAKQPLLDPAAKEAHAAAHAAPSDPKPSAPQPSAAAGSSDALLSASWQAYPPLPEEGSSDLVNWQAYIEREIKELDRKTSFDPDTGVSDTINWVEYLRQEGANIDRAASFDPNQFASAHGPKETDSEKLTLCPQWLVTAWQNLTGSL